jgi:hypothetical protein
LNSESNGDWARVVTIDDLDRDTAVAKEQVRQQFRAFCAVCGLRPTDKEVEATLAPIFRQLDEHQAPLRLQLQPQHVRRPRLVH